MKLNFGCGRDYKDGWINVDFDPKIKADLHFDLKKKFPLKNGSASYILANDILEHFTKEEAKRFLKECFRILDRNGKIQIRVPDIFQIYEQFRKDPDVLIKFLYGDTEFSGDLGSHKFGYTKGTLVKILKVSGFVPLYLNKETTNIICLAQKVEMEAFPMKILISGLDSGGRGGGEVFLSSLAKELQEKGVEIIFATVVQSPFSKLLKKEGFRVLEVPIRMDIIGNWKGLIKFILFFPLALISYFLIVYNFKREGGDFVILSGFADKLILPPISKLLGLPLVWIEFSPLSPVFEKNLQLPKILYRLVKNLPDLVIVPTLNTKKQLIPETRISESKIRIIPCGIKILDDMKIKTIKEEGSKLRKQLLLQSKNSGACRPVIGMVSRLEEGKGQDILIQAVALLVKKIKSFSVVIVGEGDQLPLKILSKKLRVDSFVKFLGYREDVYEVMSMFDVFVFPTRWKLEGFGLVSLEAMMMGIPLIASNAGPIPEVVGDAGILIDPDAKSLAGAIERVVKDKTLRDQLVLKGKERARDFAIEKIADKYKDELISLKRNA